MKSRCIEDGFTLLELLVVIAIMAVLMGITVPTFSTMGKGSGMRGAVAQLKSTLALSRQWAITHRQPVYVLFPDGYDTQFKTPSAAANAFKAYAVFGVTGDTKVEPIRGEYITDWKTLPQDMVFDDDPAIAQNLFKPVNLISIAGPGDTNSYYAVQFQPNGTITHEWGSGGYEIYLKEGWMIVDTNDFNNPDYGTKENGLSRSIELTQFGTIKVYDHNK